MPLPKFMLPAAHGYAYIRVEVDLKIKLCRILACNFIVVREELQLEENSNPEIQLILGMASDGNP